ncbi:hypothetical protein [Streptomyces sp. NPDC020917]|uniref:hypothetical protein n=1 Tax=Streptomyces sp. NPDC020917 TaxID=3365102 RepID=UPI00379B64BF
MTTRRLAQALTTATLLVLAVAGCQSGGGSATAKAPPPSATTAAAADTVPRPAPVTSMPVTVVTTSSQLLSKKWGPRLDTLSGDGVKACRSIHTQACARAVAAADKAARGVLDDIQITGTTGRYIQARRQAEDMTGAAAAYDQFACASASPKAPDSYCAKYVLNTLPGAVVLKSQLRGDEHQAGLL